MSTYRKLAMSDKSVLSNPFFTSPIEDRDPNRAPPVPSQDCLYGLIGHIARAGSENSEANPFAIALHAITFLGCCLGRTVHLQIGDTIHSPIIFSLHVGRSGRGRKGDALSLVRKLHKSIVGKSQAVAPGLHTGGLSTREGLIYLIHDGYVEGRNEVPPVQDKRLWIIEPEFANVLQQTRREGNTLSPALRELFDSNSLKPATKGNRIGVAEPHVVLSAGITPTELTSGIPVRELLNSFANRIVMISAERLQFTPFPEPTPKAVVEQLGDRIIEVIEFANKRCSNDADSFQLTLSSGARNLYQDLYTGELAVQLADEKIMTLLERRAPVLLRIAMIFAAADLASEIDECHLNAAAAWTRYWADSADYIFAANRSENCSDEITILAERITKFLSAKEDASRTELTVDCFGGHVAKPKLDQALTQLLTSSPPIVVVTVIPRIGGPGSPTKRYRLVAKHAKSANAVLGQLVLHRTADAQGENSANAMSDFRLEISQTSRIQTVLPS